jgi:hypothetical protein
MKEYDFTLTILVDDRIGNQRMKLSGKFFNEDSTDEAEMVEVVLKGVADAVGKALHEKAIEPEFAELPEAEDASGVQELLPVNSAKV